MNWWRRLVRTVLRSMDVRPHFRRKDRHTACGESAGVPFRVDSVPASAPGPNQPDPQALGRVLAAALKGRATAAAVIVSEGSVHLVTVGESGSARTDPRNST